jgi:Pyridoxamine 5'-phosphate oxidase
MHHQRQVRVSVPGPSLRLMALSVHERELFLAEPHIAALSVSVGPDCGPLTVPIWYQYTPGGEAWVLTSPDSRKARLIEQAGRFSLMVQRIEPTVRYVSVEGPATRTAPRTDELLLEMSQRYLRPDKVQSYIEYAKRQLADEVALYMQPQRWLSADLGAL